MVSQPVDYDPPSHDPERHPERCPEDLSDCSYAIRLQCARPDPPFATSTGRPSGFTLLNARNCLHLVTDAVHEDDALCLALTCRALRDALWARFPRRPAEDSRAGVRVRTRDAAVVGTVGRLAWARGRPDWPDWPDWPWLEPREFGHICMTAARYGALASLQWARANGCGWYADTCSAAAGGGHLAVLQWARANGCDWDAGTCWMAAAGGRLAVLQWLRANGCHWVMDECLHVAPVGSETREWIQAQLA
jgi:hypothetical protein